MDGAAGSAKVQGHFLGAETEPSLQFARNCPNPHNKNLVKSDNRYTTRNGQDLCGQSQKKLPQDCIKMTVKESWTPRSAKTIE